MMKFDLEQIIESKRKKRTFVKMKRGVSIQARFSEMNDMDICIELFAKP